MRIEALPEIVRGRPVAFAADGGAEYRGEGWSEPEASHRWTEGPDADLWFATHDTAPAVLRLEMPVPLLSANWISLFPPKSDQ